MSTSKVDFGHVLFGHYKTMMVRFRNTKEVPVEWSFKEEKDRMGRRLPPHERPFGIEPPMGVLPPGAYTDVQIHFQPNQSVDHEMKQVLSIKVKDNKSKKNLIVKGFGDDLRVQVMPNHFIRLGPCLPYDSNVMQVRCLSVLICLCV